MITILMIQCGGEAKGKYIQYPQLGEHEEEEKYKYPEWKDEFSGSDAELCRYPNRASWCDLKAISPGF